MSRASSDEVTASPAETGPLAATDSPRAVVGARGAPIATTDAPTRTRARLAPAPTTSEPDGTQPVDRSRFRPDIEGLRAIAVGSVLLWHAGLTVLPGGFVGVDVFFVISGYLMTSLLGRELQTTGRVSFPGFYARRARRLLPAASFVLVSVVAMTVAFVPRIRWPGIGKDVLASGLYGINWRLANGAVDYLAAHEAPSPVQHFWSLAVEEQFYILWPVVLGLIGLIARRRASKTGPMVLGLAVIALPSFAWSVYYTSAAPEKAYFVTTTRLWELAVGGLVALLGPLFVRILRPPTAAAIGWCGLAAVVATMLLLQPTVPFPGSIAAVPILGTAAVIAASPSAGAAGPVRILGLPPMLWVGKLSYSLYLWHWPLLVVGAAVLLDRPGNLPAGLGLAVVLLSVAPAYLSFRMVEEPVRRRRGERNAMRRWALRLGAACTALSIGAGAALLGASAMSAPDATLPPGTLVGAEVLPAAPLGSTAGGVVADPGAILPNPVKARNDIPDIYANGCHLAAPATRVKVEGCTYGDPAGRFTVALVGDSHAAQWAPTLEKIARDQGWRLLAYTKSGCPFADATVPLGKDKRPYAACDAWRADVLRVLGAQKPDLVVTSSTEYLVYGAGGILNRSRSEAAMVAGLRRSWAALAWEGIHVAAVADTPRPGFDLADCVSAHPDDVRPCAFSRNVGFGQAGKTVSAAAVHQPGVRLVNLGDWICPGTLCAPVIGHVLVFRDADHITATYATTLSDVLLKELGPFAKPR